MNSDYNRAYLEAVDKGLGILRTDDIEYSSSQAVGLSIPIGELKRLKRLIANIEEAKGRANITYDAKKFLENFRFPSPATYPDNYRIYTDHNGKQRLYIKMRSFSDPNMLTLEKFKGIKWKTYNSALRKCFLIFSVLILLVAMGLVAYDIKVSYSEQLDAYNRDQLKLMENAEQLLKNKKHDNRNDLCNLLEKYSSLKNDVSKNHFIYFKLPILKFDLCDGFLMSEKKLIDNISYSDDLKKLLQGLRKDFFKNFQEIINLMKKLRSMNATYTNNLINIYRDEYVKTLHDILNDYLKSNSLSDFRKFQDLMNNEDNRKFIGKDKINKILNSDSYKALLKLLEEDTSKSKYEGLSLEIGKLLKDNNINSFSGLLEMLNSFDETSYKEIHYKENKVSSKRTNEEKLYRYDKAYYIEQVETYYVLGNEKFDEAKTYVGIEDNNYFDILISSSSYVRKQEIVDSKPSNNQISLTEAENNLKKSKYINNFFNQFQDAYSGYVKQDKIVVSTNNNVTNFSSFSKNVWSNGINCDYKTFTCDFTFENDNLSSIKYLVNDYGDELFDIENDCLKEGAEPIDVYSMDIDFLIDNSKNECPINPNDYFVSEIKKASYSRTIHVNDYVFSSSINLDEFAPSTALDYSYIDIVSVENLNNQVVLSVEDDTIVALTTGKAKLNIAMKYSSNVIYSLEVEVI